MRTYKKADFPVAKIRRYLEPGPIVMVSSAWKGKSNIMTMGWHTVMEFEPSRIGCYIFNGNYSFELIRRSICHKAALGAGLAAAARIDHSEKHRSPTRNTPQPRAFRGTGAKEFPIL